MKKALKIIGIALLAIFIIGGIFIAYVGATDIPSYEVKKIDYQLQTTPELEARGRKLASMLCKNCHLNNKTHNLSGKLMVDVPAEFGMIHSPNITQDKKYGIGNWTNGEILYLLRTGIKKDGQYAPPYMAKLPTMADEDVDAIIAFLRSDDPMVAASAEVAIDSKPSLLTKILCRTVFQPFPMPKQRIAMPDTNNSIELGRYLAHNLECYSCHSADFKSNDFLNPTQSEGYFGGGNKPLDEQGRVMVTPNLTPDKETGIGKWSKEKFIRAVKFGIIENEKALTYPMMPYTELTDTEAEAIYKYLQTIPPIKNKVVRSRYD